MPEEFICVRAASIARPVSHELVLHQSLVVSFHLSDRFPQILGYRDVSWKTLSIATGTAHQAFVKSLRTVLENAIPTHDLGRIETTGAVPRIERLPNHELVEWWGLYPFAVFTCYP